MTNPVGRPSELTDKIKKILERLALTGTTNEDMARIVGVHPATLYKWFLKFPEFGETIKNIKETADTEIEASLFDKARGKIKTTETTISECPKTGKMLTSTKTKTNLPSDTAMIFWLKNRQPKKWRDKQEVEHSVSEIKIDEQDKDL